MNQQYRSITLTRAETHTGLPEASTQQAATAADTSDATIIQIFI